jgi:hypothetical protein
VLHQDYLMRTIRALTQAFLNLIGASDESPAELRRQVDGTLANHFATQPELLAGLDIDRLEDEPPRVCGELGRLFALQASLCHKLGDPLREEIAATWAVHSFRRGFLAADVPAEIEEAAFAFLRSASAQAFVGRYDARTCYAALFRSASNARRLAHAEDALFAAMELGAHDDTYQQGLTWWQEVAEWDDDALERGGMSRDEVRNVVQDLTEFSRD